MANLTKKNRDKIARKYYHRDYKDCCWARKDRVDEVVKGTTQEKLDDM